jgi:hypothetical protein
MLGTCVDCSDNDRPAANDNEVSGGTILPTSVIGDRMHEPAWIVLTTTALQLTS